MVVRSVSAILLAVMATVDAMALSCEKFGPMRWTGEGSTRAQFKFEFTNWARRHGANVPKLMTDVCDQVEYVRVTEMEEEPLRVSGLLMTDLVVKTCDKAQRLLMNLDEPSNGFEAWQRLTKLAEGGDGIKPHWGIPFWGAVFALLGTVNSLSGWGMLGPMGA